VLVLHNRSPDELDYERTPNLRAVLISGNKLSRGLTLEGLLVSFYVRRANAYDTLLQMGRWFGYREDYVDLTRLYTTTVLADNFRDLATYEEELRQEIRRYEQLHLTPMDFGPRIRKHPPCRSPHATAWVRRDLSPTTMRLHCSKPARSTSTTVLGCSTTSRPRGAS
jgi:Z1 domain